MTMSATTIDTMLWHIERELMDRWGVDTARREMAPLRRYVNTGRASLDFLRKLYAYGKPFMVARRLHQGGSDDEIIERVQKLIGYKPYV